VHESFKRTFRTLFGGGEGKLILQEEGDLLEAGIDIIARPPGKRQQSISLLSGGEKALTATALLFALFETKPSPFCVLDEIDAPLDDTNITRFSALLSEYAGKSQFIVITHSKLTMEKADVLYGVTMEEAGVSKIISAKFRDEKAVKA
jgi:chromosome segregation protein